MEMTPDELRLAIRYYAKRYRGRIALGVVALLAVSILTSVYYSVEADSEGVVLRFGKYSDTTMPGRGAPATGPTNLGGQDDKRDDDGLDGGGAHPCGAGTSPRPISGLPLWGPSRPHAPRHVAH